MSFLLQVFADALVKRAYENWEFVIEYDGKALLSLKPKKTITTRSESLALTQFPATYDQHASQQYMPISDPTTKHSIDAEIVTEGN